MTRTAHAALAAQDVHTVTRGRVSRAVVTRAQEKVAALAQNCGEPVLSARVKLTRPAEPGPDRLPIAEASLNVNGRMVRAEAEGMTVREALTELLERLRVRLDRTARDWRSLQGRRHRNTIRTATPALAPGRQAVLRRKYVEPEPTTVDHAIFDMELRDYDFYLFTDAATGGDAVVWRSGDGYRMAWLKAVRPPVTYLPVSVDEEPTPALTLDEAIERLAPADRLFLFYADALTGRGALLYRRRDGGFGHITAVSGW
ncbi:sigma 54 modulation/S30EA ribosomal C-terminal domain-containing protein [Thermopolyspora sp. NPDC052614]|uniref:ribosome hibernation promotion factor n=1 Tax=Thermopolyspora sp. NPDC052614 TaxID=3155682 RepID=UPI00343C56A5